MKTKCSLISAMVLVIIASYLNVVPAFAQIQGGDPRGSCQQYSYVSQGGDIFGGQQRHVTQGVSPWVQSPMNPTEKKRIVVEGDRVYQERSLDHGSWGTTSRERLK